MSPQHGPTITISDVVRNFLDQGTANILTSARDTGFTFNITHNSAFTGSNPHVSLGINRLELDTASSTRIYFLINVGTQTLTNFVVQVGLVSGFKIKYIALSYFARASTLSYIFVDYQSVIRTLQIIKPPT